MLLTDIQEVPISDLGCHGHPEAVSGWGWAARCHGYRPPRGRHPRCSICAAGATMMTSALVYSEGSVQCTSTGHLDIHRHQHIHFSYLLEFPVCSSDVNNDVYALCHTTQDGVSFESQTNTVVVNDWKLAVVFKDVQHHSIVSKNCYILYVAAILH